ncbi:transposase [Pseudonocardia alaniniphila]|uniref:transposase n=1 Tax=Pseudonocardia alaniniphila TaxID=75291 RepID=UPI003375611C
MTAPTEDAATASFEEFIAAWRGQYPAITRSGALPGRSSCPSSTTTWRSDGSSATNAIENLNARYRRAVKARGHFPTEQAALKCLYLFTRSLNPTGKCRARWATRWKPALTPSPAVSSPCYTVDRNTRCE